MLAFSDNKGTALFVFKAIHSEFELKFSFSGTYMLQRFGNDAVFFLEISVKSNGWDKNASVIYPGSGPGQTSTDSACPEQVPVHGPKV